MLEEHVRYYLSHLTGTGKKSSASTSSSGGSVSCNLRASVEMQSELQKLEDLQLCYSTLCMLTTGTDTYLSEANLDKLPAEYASVVDRILLYFTQPPDYAKEGHSNSARSSSYASNTTKPTYNKPTAQARTTSNHTNNNLHDYYVEDIKQKNHKTKNESTDVDDFVLVPATPKQPSKQQPPARVHLVRPISVSQGVEQKVGRVAPPSQYQLKRRNTLETLPQYSNPLTESINKANEGAAFI